MIEKIKSLFWNAFQGKRVRTPTVIQMEAVECGAASLCIVLSYYGCYVPLETLRIECGVSRDGANALNMKRVAERYGLKVKVYQKGAEELSELNPPMIVFWEFMHFLVVEGFSKDYIFLNDPASGPRKVTLKEFAKSYSGIVFTFEKTEQFQPFGQPPSIWPGIIERIRSSKAALTIILTSGFGIMLIGAIYPGFNKIFFDTIIEKHVFSWSNWFIFGMSALTLLMGFMLWFEQYLLTRLNTKLSITFSEQYLMHILKLPITFFQQRFGGEIAYRLSLNDIVINELTGRLAPAFISLLFAVFYALMMFFFSVKIALIVILLTSLNFLAVLVLQRRRNDAYARLQQDYGKFMGFAIGGLAFIESIKAMGDETAFFSKLIGYFKKSLNTEQRLGKVNAISITLPIFIQTLIQTTLFGIGGWMLMTENFTMGLYTSLSLFITNFTAPVTELVNLGQSVQTLKIDMARIDDVMKNSIDPLFTNQSSKVTGPIKRLEGYLEMRNVSYGYSTLEPPFIQDFSLHLEPGQRVALVGPSGCGKTTIGRLISGLVQPWSGEILYDGKKRIEHSRQDLLASLTTIDQEIFLFSGTIQDNITLHDPTINDEDVIQAAKDASIHEEIVQKQGGYSYLLTEGGMNIGGGQRQRIEIARGLLQNPKILILDEATSSLDSKTEEVIIQNIRQRGCTCVMVAHRLSSIRDCDEIIVLDKGRIIQRGNHETLKNTPGTYQDLVNTGNL